MSQYCLRHSSPRASVKCRFGPLIACFDLFDLRFLFEVVWLKCRFCFLKCRFSEEERPKKKGKMKKKKKMKKHQNSSEGLSELCLKNDSFFTFSKGSPSCALNNTKRCPCLKLDRVVAVPVSTQPLSLEVSDRRGGYLKPLILQCSRCLSLSLRALG